MGENKGRMPYLDYAKGIGIVLVVLGHVSPMLKEAGGVYMN